jgi:hypothetical protein
MHCAYIVHAHAHARMRSHIELHRACIVHALACAPCKLAGKGVTGAVTDERRVPPGVRLLGQGREAHRQ